MEFLLTWTASLVASVGFWSVVVFAVAHLIK
jgi:hypothetical protein